MAAVLFVAGSWQYELNLLQKCNQYLALQWWVGDMFNLFCRLIQQTYSSFVEVPSLTWERLSQKGYSDLYLLELSYSSFIYNFHVMSESICVLCKTSPLSFWFRKTNTSWIGGLCFDECSWTIKLAWRGKLNYRFCDTFYLLMPTLIQEIIFDNSLFRSRMMIWLPMAWHQNLLGGCQ